MGKKGDKQTKTGSEKAKLLVERLQPIGGISSKKMFGGHGIFFQGKMFGIVDSRGGYYLKMSDGNRGDFEAYGAVQHGRMPYFSIPDAILEDSELLLNWAQKAIDGLQA